MKIGEGNWIYGIYKKLYFFTAKVYNGGSRFGINQGRVSKLEVKRFSQMWYKDIPWNEVGETLYNYDRGEDLDHPIGAEIAQFP
ncbi:MAG: hypothetical protein EOP45_13685 [Sphingobacteriaceae bacterium]|nr:MAG: hypothetical protein EOP45_13685 [Sphingobacteriaceae bacterium]